MGSYTEILCTFCQLTVNFFSFNHDIKYIFTVHSHNTNTITTREKKKEEIRIERPSYWLFACKILWLCHWQHTGHKDAFTKVPFMLTTSVHDTGTKAKAVYTYVLYLSLLSNSKKQSVFVGKTISSKCILWCDQK